MIHVAPSDYPVLPCLVATSPAVIHTQQATTLSITLQANLAGGDCLPSYRFQLVCELR